MFSDVSDHLSDYNKDWRYFTGKLVKTVSDKQVMCEVKVGWLNSESQWYRRRSLQLEDKSTSVKHVNLEIQDFDNFSI